MSNYPRQTEECPVCYAKMKVEISAIDWMGPICEHYETCPNGCYAYEFAYGSTNVYVTVRDHHIMFGWHYSDDQQALRAESDAIDVACEAARRALLEDLLKDKARLDWLEKDPFENMEAVDWRLRNWKDGVRSAIDFMVDGHHQPSSSASS